MHINDDSGAPNSLLPLTGDEIELLKAYRATDRRGKESILARSLNTAADYPDRRLVRLSLVPALRDDSGNLNLGTLDDLSSTAVIRPAV